MNKLQEEILEAISKTNGNWSSDINRAQHSKAAAEVALKWIEKAFNDSVKKEPGGIVKYREFGDWLIENGLTPTEPEKS